MSACGAAWLPGTLLLALIGGVPALADGVVSGSVAEPEGYRLERYDAPVPAGLSGARTVNALEVQRLMSEEAAVVIDVVPQHRRPDALPDEALWLPVDHVGIEGALWLPDTGYGAQADVTRDYLFEHVHDATDGRRDHPIVFYCRIDCWMSWNAAKRAVRAGYRQVHWLRDGLDDWQFEDLPTAVLVPAPGPRLPRDE